MKRVWTSRLVGALLFLAVAVVLAGGSDRRKAIPGIVTAVDTVNSTVSIETGPRKHRVVMTFPVAASAEIEVNDGPATLADVQAGMRATLILNRARDTVVRINAHGRDDD